MPTAIRHPATAVPSPRGAARRMLALLAPMVVLATLACAGRETPYPALDQAAPSTSAMDHPAAHPATDPLPLDQLQAVKQATARYRSLGQALRDGYVDIDVVIPNMGRHYLRQEILDGTFEVERPELLVYAEHAGRMELVAVEYAVPLSLSATAPEGFRGNADQWMANQQFQLWTLHAWIWQDNPDGVFAPTNPLAP